jgi:hypothetical protein
MPISLSFLCSLLRRYAESRASTLSSPDCNPTSRCRSLRLSSRDRIGEPKTGEGVDGEEEEPKEEEEEEEEEEG